LSLSLFKQFNFNDYRLYCTYLPQTVATIGSDVETLKAKIKELNTFKQTASKQIEEINQKALQVKLLLYLSLLKSYHEKQQNCESVEDMYNIYIYICINKNSYSIFHTFLLFTQLSSVEIYYRIKTIYTHTATWRYNITINQKALQVKLLLYLSLLKSYHEKQQNCVPVYLENAVPSLYSVLAVHMS
jgi:hypothetical protein